MKIIAIIPANYDNKPAQFIVELSNAEMTAITKGSTYPAFNGDFTKVTEVEICKKFNHAMEVIGACERAIKLPAQLEAIAECLKTIVPKLETILSEESEVET